MLPELNEIAYDGTNGAQKTNGEDLMAKSMMSAVTLLTSTLLYPAATATAAEVTPDRLINADKEPQNWLMNHRTYDAQRYSPLDKMDTR